MKNILYIAILSLLCCIPAFAQADGPVKLKGQVVCSSCWFEAKDRKKTRYGTVADIKCATDCSEMGLPQALAVEDENETFHVVSGLSIRTCAMRGPRLLGFVVSPPLDLAGSDCTGIVARPFGSAGDGGRLRPG